MGTFIYPKRFNPMRFLQTLFCMLYLGWLLYKYFNLNISRTIFIIKTVVVAVFLLLTLIELLLSFWKYELRIKHWATVATTATCCFACCFGISLIQIGMFEKEDKFYSIVAATLFFIISILYLVDAMCILIAAHQNSTCLEETCICDLPSGISKKNTNSAMTARHSTLTESETCICDDIELNTPRRDEATAASERTISCIEYTSTTGHDEQITAVCCGQNVANDNNTTCLCSKSYLTIIEGGYFEEKPQSADKGIQQEKSERHISTVHESTSYSTQASTDTRTQGTADGTIQAIYNRDFACELNIVSAKARTHLPSQGLEVTPQTDQPTQTSIDWQQPTHCSSVSGVDQQSSGDFATESAMSGKPERTQSRKQESIVSGGAAGTLPEAAIADQGKSPNGITFIAVVDAVNMDQEKSPEVLGTGLSAKIVSADNDNNMLKKSSGENQTSFKEIFANKNFDAISISFVASQHKNVDLQRKGEDNSSSILTKGEIRRLLDYTESQTCKVTQTVPMVSAEPRLQNPPFDIHQQCCHRHSFCRSQCSHVLKHHQFFFNHCAGCSTIDSRCQHSKIR